MIPGCAKYQDPYHSKLGRQLGLAAIASGFILPQKLRPTLILAYDALTVLNQVGIYSAKINARLKNVDIISTISSLWDISSFDIMKDHVYGHQNDLNRPLTLLKKNHCRMDKVAKAIDIVRIQGDIAKPIFNTTQIYYCSITCRKNLFTSRIQATLYKKYHRQKAGSLAEKIFRSTS